MEHLEQQPIQFYQEVELPETAKRKARQTNWLSGLFAIVFSRRLESLTLAYAVWGTHQRQRK